MANASDCGPLAAESIVTSPLQIVNLSSDNQFAMHDIAIVGGGPGGLYAAVQLARRGFDVAVLRRALVGWRAGPLHGRPRGRSVRRARRSRELHSQPAEHGPVLRTLRRILRLHDAQTEARRRSTGRCSTASSANALKPRAHASTPDARDRRAGIRTTTVTLTTARRDAPDRERPACILACGANYTLQRRLGLGMASCICSRRRSKFQPFDPATRRGPLRLGHRAQGIRVGGARVSRRPARSRASA